MDLRIRVIRKKNQMSKPTTSQLAKQVIKDRQAAAKKAAEQAAAKKKNAELDKAAFKQKQDESFTDMLEGTIKAINKAKKNTAMQKSVAGKGVSPKDKLRGSRANAKLGAEAHRWINHKTGGASSFTTTTGTRVTSMGRTGKGHLGADAQTQTSLKKRLSRKHSTNESFMSMLEGAVKALNKAKKNAAIGTLSARKLTKKGQEPNRLSIHPNTKAKPAKKIKDPVVGRMTTPGKHGKVEIEDFGKLISKRRKSGRD